MKEMAMQAVVLTLFIRYPLKPHEEAAFRDYDARARLALKKAETNGMPYVAPRTYEELMRDVSERFIGEAVHHVYGDSMPREARKIWASIQAQLAADARELTLDATTFRWLYDTCTSDKVKVTPGDSLAHMLFTERLDQLKATLEPAPAAEAAG